MIERTHDVETIRKIICDPRVLAEFGVDDTPIPVHDSIYHMIASDEELMGITSFFPVDGVSWSPHMAVLPEHRGIGVQLLKKASEWMFVNTGCKSLQVGIPALNTRMINFLDRCGFERSSFDGANIVMKKDAPCLG